MQVNLDRESSTCRLIPIVNRLTEGKRVEIQMDRLQD